MSEQQKSKSKRRYEITGARLGARGIVARAMLETGASLRSVQKATGISQTTAVVLKRKKLLNPTHVEAVKKTFRGRAALILDDALDAVTKRKLGDSSAPDLMRVAEKAQQMAGLAEKPSGLHGQLLVLQQFNLKAGLPSVSTLDLESIPSKQPPLDSGEIDTPEASGGPADHSQN